MKMAPRTIGIIKLAGLQSEHSLLPENRPPKNSTAATMKAAVPFTPFLFRQSRESAGGYLKTWTAGLPFTIIGIEKPSYTMCISTSNKLNNRMSSNILQNSLNIKRWLQKAILAACIEPALKEFIKLCHCSGDENSHGPGAMPSPFFIFLYISNECISGGSLLDTIIELRTGTAGTKRLCAIHCCAALPVWCSEQRRLLTAATICGSQPWI